MFDIGTADDPYIADCSLRTFNPSASRQPSFTYGPSLYR